MLLRRGSAAIVPGYNRYPDEKGTESLLLIRLSEKSLRYNRYPDEKGTERLHNTCHAASAPFVTTVTPMKRGLKDYIILAMPHRLRLLQPLPR